MKESNQLPRKKTTLSQVLAYTFGLSYLALKHSRDNSFSAWTRSKRRINSRLNLLCLQYCGAVDYSLPGISSTHTREYVFEVLVGIINRHVRVRQRILGKKPGMSRQEFTRRAYVRCILTEVTALLRATSRVLRSFSITAIDQLPTSGINLAYQFPEHAFTVSGTKPGEKGGRPVFSSFGDYYDNVSNLPLMSLDGYTRPSKQAESAGEFVEKHTPRLSRVPVSKRTDPLRAIWLLSVLCFRLTVMVFMALYNRAPFLILLNATRKWLFSVQVLRLLNNLGKNGIEVKNLYVMPFNDLGNLRYTNDLDDKIVTFSFSQNIFIFPAYSNLPRASYTSDDFNNAIADVSLTSMLYKGRHAGYTNLVHCIKTLKTDINDKFGPIFDTSGTPDEKESPVFLGFESQDAGFADVTPDHIGVYELPPESLETQYSRSFCGDMLCCIDNVRSFLLDISALCDQGLKVIYKPKYSLKNYPEEYRELLEELTRKHPQSFQVANPYAMAEQLFDICFLTISMPYTSTYHVAKALGNPSVYYLPKSEEDWGCRRSSHEIVFGLPGLLKLARSYA